MNSLPKFSEMSLERLLSLRKSVYAGKQLEDAIKKAVNSGLRSDIIPKQNPTLNQSNPKQNPFSSFPMQDDELPTKEYPYFFDTGIGRFAYKTQKAAEDAAKKYMEKASKTERGKNFHGTTIRFYHNKTADAVSTVSYVESGNKNVAATDYGNPRNPTLNQSSESEELFQQFRGRPSDPDEQFEIEEEIEVPDELTNLAEVIELGIFDGNDSETPLDLSSEKLVLAADPKTKQLFIIGKVELDLDDFDLAPGEANKLKVNLGNVSSITYFADKQQFEDDVKEGANWYHLFGEDLTWNGKRENAKKVLKKLQSNEVAFPTLIYDTVNHSLELVGGSYNIDESGIRN